MKQHKIRQIFKMPWVLFRKMFLMVTFTRDKKSNFPKTETIQAKK